MNPNFLTDGSADFRFDAFNEAHANPEIKTYETGRSENLLRFKFLA
jgi:hypothetical protein